MSGTVNTIYEYVESAVIRHRRSVLVFIHFLHAALAYYLAFVVRFEAAITAEYMQIMLNFLPIILLIRLVLFAQAGLYKDMWGYSSIGDLVKILKSITIGSAIFFVTVRYLIGSKAFPLSIYALDWMLLIIITGGSRMSIRVFREYLHARPFEKRILIVGAGDASDIILRDIKGNRKTSYEPIGFIDEDPHKKGFRIHGVPILGPISSMPKFIEKLKPDEILVTTSSTEHLRQIYEICKPYNITIKKLPELNDLLSGNYAVAKKLGQHLIEANAVTEEKVQEALDMQKKEGGRLGSKLIKLGYITEDSLISFLNKQFGISHMKPISLEDLLQREPVKTNIKTVRNFIENKSVMVTGAGGSIGSELCRQIIKYNPVNIILFERYENNLFKIDQELQECKNNATNGEASVTIIPVIGDMTDVRLLEHVFSRHRPQIIFHAAAHKHVPLMEYNPIEAVKNNILGTRNLLDISSESNIENFVMVSTDKAVNPTSIMGATKRVAEFLTMTKNSASTTKFTTVRFGNVLGSNGSVLKTFENQLKKGGPLTVTHPDINRYFMLISEAVQLVLLAASSGNGGEIFVLNMGDAIKIEDLAENVIRLSGFVPNKEIKIKYTGLRPGEKLFEELFDTTEKIVPSESTKFKMAIPQLPSYEKLFKYIAELERIVQLNEIDKVVPTIQKIVPNFNRDHISDVDHPVIM
jgi:FlaA1/EpsC-like NDP-sugar epimerase